MHLCSELCGIWQHDCKQNSAACVYGKLMNHLAVSVITLNHREILGTTCNYTTVFLSDQGMLIEFSAAVQQS